jgi:hypothetical protein
LVYFALKCLAGHCAYPPMQVELRTSLPIRRGSSPQVVHGLANICAVLITKPAKPCAPFIA